LSDDNQSSAHNALANSLLRFVGVPLAGIAEDAIPFYLSRDPKFAVEELMREAASRKHLTFDFGEIVPSQSDTLRFLVELAKVRRDNLYSFVFSCSINNAVSKADSHALKLAGVKKVTILDGLQTDIEQLRTIRRLSEAELEIEWKLTFPTARFSEVDCFTEQIKNLHHLPPPREIRVLGAVRHFAKLEDATKDWSTVYMPRSLTYARGPNFTRIFDRRAGKKAFVTLTAHQCTLYHALEEGLSIHELSSIFSGYPLHQIDGLLNTLLQSGLVYRSGTCYLSLAVRRQLEESWTSGLQ
jgi:hypothetical protein